MKYLSIQKSNKVKFFTFLFLFLVLFFCNPLDVFAGFNTVANHSVTDAVLLQEKISNDSDGAKTIYNSSYELGYFHYGETEELIKYRQSYEASHGKTSNKLGFIKWLLENTDLALEEDIVAYGDCIVFNDVVKGDPYVCTGWLYLYCDSNRYLEYAENLAGIGNDYIPLYFEDGSTEGSMFLTIPADYFYYPVSNLIRNDELGVFQTQIYSPENNFKTDAFIRIESLLFIKEYYKEATTGKGKVHDVDDFAGIYGLSDLKVYDSTLPKQYAWVMAFCCSALVKNADASLPEGSTGHSYQYPYPINKSLIHATMGRLTEELSPYYIPTLSYFFDIDSLFAACRSGGPFYGMKEAAQTYGIDIIFSGVVNNGAAARVGKQKERIMGWGPLLDVSATMDKLYKKVDSMSTEDETFVVNADNIYQIYQECMVPFQTNYPSGIIFVPNGKTIPAGFVNVSGKDVGLRFVWSASSGHLMADTSINFAKDTPGVYNASKSLKSDTWQNSKTTLKNSKYLSSLSDFGTERYNGTSDSEKIKSVLVFLQYYPEMLDSISRANSTVNRDLGGATGREALKKLNALAVEDYDKWQKCLLDIGDVIYKHTLASNNPSNGWSSAFGMLNTNGAYYNVFTTGISICQTFVVRPEISDFVLSNSYNMNESTFAFSESDTEAKYNPTARSVIDWMHGTTLAGLDRDTSTVGGKSSVLNKLSKYTTIIDNSSSWKNYDINCVVKANGVKSGGFVRDNNNTFKIEPESNLAILSDANSEQISYDTLVFVGRIPEASEEDRVTVDEIRVLAKASYNQFESDFDASYDEDSSDRYNFAAYGATGTAINTLSSYFETLHTDYNTTVLFNVYKNHGTHYNNQNAFQVRANPVAIQKAVGVENYKKEDYPELGPRASGYGSITGGAFSAVSAGSTFAPGDVVAYNLDYRIPNPDTVRNEIGRGSSSLLRKGQWYDEYGSVLSSDVDFWIVPKATSSTVERFEEINKNTNNDWARMRIESPVMDNIYFSEVNVTGAGINNRCQESVKEGIRIGLSGQGDGHIWSTSIGRGDFVSGDRFSNNSYTVTAKWKYWCRGKSINSVDPSLYNFVNYYNGFKLESGTLNATSATGAGIIKEMTIGEKPSLTLNPSTDFMNAAKEKSIRLQVPKNECNDYVKDWEIIIVSFDVPEKDNSVVDLVLRGSDGAIYGDVNRSNGRQHEAQTIPKELSSATLYTVVQRLAPQMKWQEIKANNDTVHCHLNLSVDDGKSGGDNKHATLTAESVAGYQGTLLSEFDMPGDILLFRYNISGPFSYLTATANYRNQNDGCYDREDINMTNNYWSEIWESTKNPNFVLDIVDGQYNVQNSQSMCKKDINTCLKQFELIKPYLVFTVSQDNPNALGPWTTRVHVDMEGALPEKITGIGYMGNSNFATVNFSDTNPVTCRAEWKEMKVPYSKNSAGNTTYRMNAYINYSNCLVVPEETYYEDNRKEWAWTCNLTCNEVIDGCGTPPVTPCVFDGKRKVSEAKTFWGAGRTYYWDVVFSWTQQNNHQSDAVNQYVMHYRDGCPSLYAYRPKPDGKGTEKVLVEYREHEHCPCFCTSTKRGPNDGQHWWRNSGPGLRGLGQGQYYETWNIHIYVWSSGGGTREIGSTCVRQGEEFQWWYETNYSSNRENMPRSPYQPYSQPYRTGNGGAGCVQPCNYLTRTPDPVNVLGPYWVDIKASGTRNYNYDYRYISPSYGGGTATNKLYKWVPIPDTIIVQDNQVVGQVITLYIGVYDFKGHVDDTRNAVLGTKEPGYAWYTRETQAYCDSKTAYIVLCDSKAVIGSGMESEGLDTSSGGQNNSPGFVDGDIWME